MVMEKIRLSRIIGRQAETGTLLDFFFFSSRRRHTRFDCDWSSDVCSSDLLRQRIHHASRGLVMNQSNGVEPPARQLVIESFLIDVFAPFNLQRRRFLSATDRKSTRLNSSHSQISYAVFCLKKKNKCHVSTR